MKKRRHNEQKKLTKRGKLYLANIIAFVFVIAFFVIDSGVLYNNIFESIYKSVAVQCIFTFLSLIVYYISIIADALSARNNKDEKNNN